MMQQNTISRNQNDCFNICRITYLFSHLTVYTIADQSLADFKKKKKKKSVVPSALKQNHIRNSEMLHFNVNYCSKSCQCLLTSLFTRLIVHSPVAMNIGAQCSQLHSFPENYPCQQTPPHPEMYADSLQPMNRGGKGIKGLLAPQWIHLMETFVPQGTYHDAHYYVLLNLLSNI